MYADLKADIHGSTSCRFIACNSNEYALNLSLLNFHPYSFELQAINRQKVDPCMSALTYRGRKNDLRDQNYLLEINVSNVRSLK